MPKRLGRYEIQDELGKGGMGVVYRAVDTGIDRIVAVKTILLMGDGSEKARDLRDRLIKEMKAAGKLQHPNVVTVYDYGFDGDEPYVVMEFVEGCSVKGILDERIPAVPEALHILCEIAKALDYAHSRGVIHRDVKPANILIGGEGLVKLADFGIAKLASAQTLTQGNPIGTPQFMAPEVCSGEPATRLSDQYSLAATAYQMLAGCRLFQADNPFALFNQILNVEPRPAHEMNPRLPAAVDAVLSRGLAKRPEARFGSCVEFSKALVEACETATPSDESSLMDTRPIPSRQPAPPPEESTVRRRTGKTAKLPVPRADTGTLPTEAGHRLKIERVGIGDSMVRLRCLRAGTPAAKTILVIAEDLDRQWQLPDTEIVIVDGCSLHDVRTMRPGNDPARLGGIDLPPGVEWRKPAEFFTERLVLIRDAKSAFPGAHGVERQSNIASRFGGSPILPLRLDLLEYLTADFIRQNAYFREKDKGIEFGLRIPLEGGRGLVVSQVYGSRKDSGDQAHPIEYQEHGVPILELWPDFVSPGWKTYFCFWDSRGGDVFYAKPAGSRPEDSFAELRKSGEAEREVWELTSPPEFLECQVPRRQAGGSWVNVEAGILLPNLHAVNEQPSAEFHIGVDIGDTHTNVSLRRNTEEPRPLELRTVTHRITAPLQSDREETLYRSFLPPATKGQDGNDVFERSPFCVFFSARSRAPKDEIQPVKHGHILFYHRLYNQADIGTSRVSTNLWTPEGKARLKAYIYQICLHAAVEAFRMGGRRIHWYYSLPDRLVEERANDFQLTWSGIANWTAGSLGIRSGKAVRVARSVAVAKYFASQYDRTKAFPGTGAIFIDIGNDTSEISIWQDNRLLLRSSVRLSWEQILLDPLFLVRREVFGMIPADVVPYERSQELRDTNDRLRFGVKADGLSRDYGADILRWLVRAPGEPGLRRFLDCIGAGLCGLFYYSGLMIRHLQEIGEFQLREAGDQHLLPSVHIGGSGCGLVDWASKGVYDNASPFNQVFRDMLHTAAGWQEQARAKIHVSTWRGAEAGYGLAAAFVLDDRRDESLIHSVVSGEEFTAGGQSREATTLLTRELLKEGLKVGQLPNLKDFAEVFDGYAKRRGWNMQPIGDIEGILAAASSSIEEWMGRQRRSRLDAVELEPLFVIGLRAVLREYVDQGSDS